jgi:CHAT domain-containing protein
VRQIARTIERRAARNPSPESLGAFALVKLLGDPARQLPSAIDLLEQATSLPGAGAHLWSDLAAVYLESADRGAAWNYPRALEASLRAARIDPKLPEVRFNLALALEENLLKERAHRAWEEYEKGESDKRWRKEAAAHLHAAEAPTQLVLWKERSSELESAALRRDWQTLRKIVEEFPYRVRSHAETVLLPEWAHAKLASHNEEASRELRAARALGAMVADVLGEHMVEDSVAAIDRLFRSGETSNIAALAEAYGDYVRGADLCLENEGARGEPALASARKAFERVGSPVSAWADYNLGVCAYQRSEARTAIERLRKILVRPDIGRYPSLYGRTYWMIGLSHMVLGEPAEASNAYEAALHAFERTHALPEVAGLQYLLGENRLFLGERRQAWGFLHRGLEIAVSEGDDRRRYSSLDEIADAARKELLMGVELLCRDEVVKLALLERDPPGVTHSFLMRSEALLQLNRREESRQDLARAKGACIRIGDPAERKRQEADILLAEGRLLAQSEPLAAVAPLGEALTTYNASGYRFPLVEAYMVRARVLLAIGRPATAERDLVFGIDEFERQRSAIKNEELRIIHFDQARDLFDLLIDLQADAPRGVEKAFGSAEQQRARVLLDRSRMGRRARPLSLREVQGAILAGVSLVAYASLPDRLLIWVVRRNTEATMVAVPVSSRRLENLVSDCRRNIQFDAPDEIRCLAALHEAILKPVLSRIPPEDRIVFVPDKSLHRVPFAALRDGSTGRFLVEDHASAVSPSASLYVERVGRSPAGNGELSLLVVANPSFDRGRFADFPDLRGADAEGKEVSALFPGRALVLKEGRATREAFLREVGRWSIVHLGAHTLLNPDHPHLSRLLLAPAGRGDTGSLTAATIQNLSLTRTRLVFLASCRSGGGALASEGVLSLARSFLIAGVPEVVGSLWDLDDKPGASLAREFYRRLLLGEGTQEALRQTQLSALQSRERDRESVRMWAALQVFGGMDGK